MTPSALRRRVLLSGTMLVTAVAGYGRRAYGQCAPAVAPNYQCSGVNVTTQTITANNATVSTVAGFSVNAGVGNAITISGDGGLSYTDTNASPLRAPTGYALDVRSHGDFAGTPGSVTINTNGALSGNSGIYTATYGTGALTITANGNVLTTATNARGIFARNPGTGALTITANGNISSPNGVGIYARNYGTALTVTTGAGTTVSGFYGIYARNLPGTGALTVTANGDVTGTGGGIRAQSYASGLTVTTGVGTTVHGGTTGLNADHHGTGAVTITTNGNVTGTTGGGIFAKNSSAGTDLAVTTGAGTTVSGGTTGIDARNYGTGALTVTVAGTVSGGTGFGIQVLGRPATVTVAGTVNGGAAGAIKFDQASAFANRLELVTGAVINGNVLGGPGTDTLALTGTGTGSFDAGLIGPGQQYQNFEAFQKTGSGSWTLTGTNTGITAFSVDAGTLFVNGSLGTTAFTVNGGTLGGNGAVGNTQVNAGATFAPGSSTPGSFMTVNGTLGLDAAATYALHLNSTTLSFANVSGTATLGGAAVNAIFANEVSKHYTILTAATRNGTFGTLTNTNLPANFHDTLSYDGTHAFLNLTLAFQTVGLNGNQQTIANVVTNFFNSGGSIPLVLGGLTANGLSQASGESATGSQQTTFNAMNQFMGVLTDPFIDGRGDGVSASGTTATGYASTQRPAVVGDAYAMFTKAPPAVSFEQRWSVWASGFGGSQTTDGNAALGSNTATSSIAGTAVGADYRISPNTLAGFALAGGGTSFSVANAGSGRSDLFQAGAFIRHAVGPAYISAALAYGWQDVTTNRTVTIAGTDMLRAEFNANAFSGRLEGGYRFVAPWSGGIGITPYAAAQFTTFDLPAYAERAIAGANTFALAFGARDVTDTRSELGIRTDKSWAMADGILTLRGRLAWAHDYDPDRAIGATFQTLPGASFVTNGAAQASDSALVTASVDKKWLNGWSTAATFEGEFSSVTRSYAGKGVVRYQW